MALPVETVVTKPVESQASRFDGTFDRIEFLKTWVRSSTQGQKIFVHGEKSISLQGPSGTIDIEDGWWLVRGPDGIFEAFDDRDFRRIYAIKGRKV
jgi:hypothetical protein